MSLRWILFFVGAGLQAQSVCQPVPRYTPCDIVFDLPDAKPGSAVELRAEFRSPRARTALMNAFWDGGSRWVIRFTPTEAGSYDFRLTSKVSAFDGKTGTFTATANKNPGWVRAANLHHFAHVDETVLTPHLWMGATVPGFPSMGLDDWKRMVDARAAQHFNHLSVTLIDETAAKDFASPELLQRAEAKIRYANDHGLLVDLAFFGGSNLLNRLLPDRQARQKWFENTISRLAAFDVTWEGVEDWETYDNGRAILKEIGDAINQFDPYKHTRSSRSKISSSPLVDDGWLRYRSYSTTDSAIESVEQQAFQFPAVNHFDVADRAGFRRALWTASMNGQYPAPVIHNDADAAAMKAWYEVMSGTRHWELEPFFDTDKGRALAYEGVEYLVYLDQPGPVTVNLEKQKYDFEWINPASGERFPFKSQRFETFTDSPPDQSHDWVLHISREGHKASMLRTFKFDSREDQPPLQLQVIESNPDKVPFDIELPREDFSLSKPVKFRVQLKRETKATKRMLFEWTGEVTVDGQSFRVLGTGSEGTLEIPANIARSYPAALHVKVYGLNGLGKLYAVDKNFTLSK